MKKFLLVSVCLLALTACSQGQQGKGTTNASSKQEATQTKKEQSKTRPLLVTSAITTKTKFKSATKKMKLSLLLFLVLNPFPQICKTWIFPS